MSLLTVVDPMCSLRTMPGEGLKRLEERSLAAPGEGLRRSEVRPLVGAGEAGCGSSSICVGINTSLSSSRWCWWV